MLKEQVPATEVQVKIDERLHGATHFAKRYAPDPLFWASPNSSLAEDSYLRDVILANRSRMFGGSYRRNEAWRL